jgi:hypothetical protein
LDPDGDVKQMPMLTVEQVAVLQGFLNRPGFGGDSISCKDSSHGTSLFLSS